MATKRRMHITRANAQNGLRKQGWPEYRKVATIRARYIPGPWTVETREGVLDMPDGGWLALDDEDYPYPIAADVFERIYEEVQSGPHVGYGDIARAHSRTVERLKGETSASTSFGGPDE